MAYQVLARKWRPNRFSELVGQDHVVTAISNALDNNRLHHAYLFTGTRGVGKTTIARIFSKSLNCEQGMSANPCGQCHTCKEIENGSFVDLLEIDAASRTKVEDTRELLDNVQYKPTRGEYKVYLIDEVHMLSKHSFNALLKTLEEPPPHVKFLLATTDPQKLPVTILSRCLQFNLKALSRDQIAGQLSYVLQQENIPFDEQAIAQLARAAQGSMRDALSLSDQAIAQGNGHVSNTIVTDMLGLMDKTQILKLVHNIFANKAEAVLALVDDFAQQAISFEQVLVEMMSLLHQVALTQYVPEACKLETVTAKAVFQLAKMLPPEQVQLAYQIALQGRKDMVNAADARVGLEMTLLRMLAFNPTPLVLSIDETNQLAQQNTHAAPSEVGSTDNNVESANWNNQQVEDLNEQQNDVLNQAAVLVVTNDDSVSIDSNDAKQMPDDTVSSYGKDNPATTDRNEPPSHHHSDFSFHGDDVRSDRESDLADFHQQSSPSETFNDSVENTAQIAEKPVVQQPSASMHTTASLIALKNQLSQKETASGVATDSVKKSEHDFSANRFKRPRNNTQDSQDSTSGDAAESFADGGSNAHSDDQPKAAHASPVATENQVENIKSGVIDTAYTSEKNDALSLTAIDSSISRSNKPLEMDESQASDTNVNLASTREAPPWDTGLQPQTDPDSPDVLVADGVASHSFDPMAHLSDPVEVEIDFDVPVFLDSGDKVTQAQQLDTWSQLIEQLKLTALTKQLALHSSYEKNHNHVTLKLLDSKPHLDTESARQQLQKALSEKFEDNIELTVEHTTPINTPYAVQQTINQVRMQHAIHVAQTDENIQRVKTAFAGHILDNSIKPR